MQIVSQKQAQIQELKLILQRLQNEETQRARERELAERQISQLRMENSELENAIRSLSILKQQNQMQQLNILKQQVSILKNKNVELQSIKQNISVEMTQMKEEIYKINSFHNQNLEQTYDPSSRHNGTLLQNSRISNTSTIMNNLVDSRYTAEFVDPFEHKQNLNASRDLFNSCHQEQILKGSRADQQWQKLKVYNGTWRNACN